MQKSISLTSALLTEKDAELEKLRNEVGRSGGTDGPAGPQALPLLLA